MIKWIPTTQTKHHRCLTFPVTIDKEVVDSELASGIGRVALPLAGTFFCQQLNASEKN